MNIYIAHYHFEEISSCYCYCLLFSQGCLWCVQSLLASSTSRRAAKKKKKKAEKATAEAAIEDMDEELTADAEP